MAWGGSGWGVAGSTGTGWGAAPRRSRVIGAGPAGGDSRSVTTAYGRLGGGGTGDQQAYTPMVPQGAAGMFNGPTNVGKSASALAKDPAAQQAYDTRPGFMNDPGIGEKWWADHQQDIGKSGDLKQFLEGSAGRLFGMDYQPSELGEQYVNMANTLGGTQAGTKGAWDIAGQLRNPTAGEGLMGDAAKYFQGPNLAHGYAEDTAGFFKQPGLTDAYARAMVPGLTQPGQGESGAYDKTDVGYDMLNRSGSYYDDVLRGASGQNVVGDESKNFLPGLRDKSYSEKLFESGDTRLDDAYQREADKRARDLTNRMAASGSFGSGATARALAEQGADIAAEAAKNRASLAGQADQARLGRADAARLFSGAAGQEGIQRADLGLRGAQAGDQSEQAIVDRIFKGGELGIEADKLGLDRTRLGGDLTHQADADALARTLGGSTVAEAGDRSLINQGKALADTGHQMTADEISRLDTSSKAGLAGDAEERARINDLIAGAKSLDDAKRMAAQQGLNIEQYLGTMTGAADTQDWQRIQDRARMAGDAQHLFEGRWDKQFQNTLDLAKAQAGVDTSGSQAISDSDKQSAQDWIQSQIQSGALTAQQGQQLQEELLAGGAVALQIVGMAKGGR